LLDVKLFKLDLFSKLRNIFVFLNYGPKFILILLKNEKKKQKNFRVTYCKNYSTNPKGSGIYASSWFFPQGFET